MEKIEVELTPVRIVGQPTGNAGSGLQTLRFQAVIEPIGSIENKQVIIPNPIYFNVPPEYVGRSYLSSFGGIAELSEQIEHYHSITPEMIVSEQVILKQDVYILPEITQTLPIQTVDVGIEDKLIEVEWLNVPSYQIIGSPENFAIRDSSGSYIGFQDVAINIRTNGIDNFRNIHTISYKYEKLYYLARSADGIQEIEIPIRNIRDTLIELPDIASVSVVYEDRQQNVRYEKQLQYFLPT